METNCSLRRAALFSKSSSGSQSAFASADRLREAGLAVFRAVERVAAFGWFWAWSWEAIWRKPRGIRLTPTSRYVRDKLFPTS